MKCKRGVCDVDKNPFRFSTNYPQATAATTKTLANERGKRESQRSSGPAILQLAQVPLYVQRSKTSQCLPLRNSMRLRRVDYNEWGRDPRSWSLTRISLGSANLIVGRNASGKTRTLNVIGALARAVTGRVRPLFDSGAYEVQLQDKKDTYDYRLVIKDKAVIEERLVKNGQSLLTRGKGGSGKIYHEKSKKLISFQCPPTEVAVHARRDNIQHKFCELINSWGMSVRHFQFGSPLGRDFIPVMNQPSALATYGTSFDFQALGSDKIVELFYLGTKEHGHKLKALVIQGMQQIGYDLTDIGLMRNPNLSNAPAGVEALMLCVKERDLKQVTDQLQMSQGMFRALAILIHAAIAELSMKSSCFLIDDIGEGLDFGRSCKIIDLLISKARRGDIQLVMTTNDRFVMNAVDLKYWTVLERKGAVVQARNYENSRQLFDNFSFTGLSNFDFLATNLGRLK